MDQRQDVGGGHVRIGYVMMDMGVGDSGKNIYFASDAHLGLNIYETPAESERRIVRWMDEIKPSAKAVYFLGDMFDYWFEYRYVVPKGYVRFIGKIAEFVDAGIPVYMFIGNHDVWMFDYFQTEVGATVYTDSEEVEMDGKIFYLAHGDGLGDPSRTFRFMRAFFRNKFCQRLYKMIHPGITMPFGFAWSRFNRKRKVEDYEKSLKDPEYAKRYLNVGREFQVQFAETYSKNHTVDFYVFGHRHIVLDVSLKEGGRVAIIGDWIRNFTYGVWNGKEFSIQRYEG